VHDQLACSVSTRVLDSNVAEFMASGCWGAKRGLSVRTGRRGLRLGGFHGAGGMWAIVLPPYLLTSLPPSSFLIPSFFLVATGCGLSKKEMPSLFPIPIRLIKEIKNSFHSRSSLLGVGE
jgi:hypothetical protein